MPLWFKSIEAIYMAVFVVAGWVEIFRHEPGIGLLCFIYTELMLKRNLEGEKPRP